MSNIVLDWNKLAAQILNVHSNPGHDTRRLAIFHIAIHDALNTIVENYKRYTSTAILIPNASSKAAVSSAAYTVLHWAITDVSHYNYQLQQENLPPIQFNANANYQSILDLYNQSLASIPEGLAKTNGVLLGIHSAVTIIAGRTNDNSSLADILSSTPNDGTATGKFRATYYTSPPPFPPPPKNKHVVKYGNVKPFALTRATQFRQNPNYFPPADKVIDRNEVNEKGRNGYSHLQSDQDIMDVWSNNKQHIVWNNIASRIMDAKSWDEWKTARLFALIHTAMADGAISMFKDAYHFYKWRPVTALNTPPVIPEWKPFKVPVPRVPEYPSTFGILGGASGKILEKFFTNVVPFNVKGFNKSGQEITLNYSKVSLALEDLTKATVYCGWNFRKSTVDGIKQGKLIGNYVYATQFN